MPPSLGAFFVLAFLRAFLHVLSVSALKEALSLPELTRRPRLPVAANLENSRQWVSVGGLHFHTHRLHFRRLKAMPVEPLEIVLYRGQPPLLAIRQARHHGVILHRLRLRGAQQVYVLRFLRGWRELPFEAAVEGDLNRGQPPLLAIRQARHHGVILH